MVSKEVMSFDFFPKILNSTRVSHWFTAVNVVANDVYNTPRDVSPSPASTAGMRSLSARGKVPSPRKGAGGGAKEPDVDSSLMAWGNDGATGDTFLI
jgi:hypothetical protein